MIKDFNLIIEQLQSHLPDYLEEKGIDTKRNFSCINPKHEDKNPSCSLLPGGTRIYCHGCSSRLDLIDIVGILESRPISGPDFITGTIKYLADKYNIPIEFGELSEDKAQQIAIYRAYRTAAEYITAQSLNKLASKEVKRRKWSQKTLTETFTGCVPDYNSFYSHLINNGYTDEFLSESDLNRSDIFNENNLIFTISDEHGNPVGFAARNLLFNKEDKTTGSKYINQRTTGIKYNIYQKGKRFYGFNLAKSEEGPLYIFEGQGDVLTAREHGISNCCAIGSTALTTDHILLLKEFNKLNIILCLDSDMPGQEKTEKLLDHKFSGHKDIKVSIVLIPNGQDPDDFIRESGIFEFNKLAKWSAFEWRLDRFADKSDTSEVARAMIPFIVNEPSYILQEDMCKVLAKATGYSLQAIQSEVFRLQNAHEEKKANERKVVVEQALQEVLENPDNAEITLTSARDKLFEISKKYDEDYMSEDACLRELNNQRLTEEAKTSDYSGFILGPDLANFQDAITGQWDKDVLMVFGGKENSGKTAFLCRLAYAIASKKENNALVIYHTIDDSSEQLLPRLVTIAEGSKTLTINQVRDPNFWSKKEGGDILYKRKTGYELVEHLVKNGSFILKDANHGSNLAYMETLINYYQEKYPTKRLVYILDNFHKLTDYSENKEERIRFKTLSNTIKGLATRYHIPVLCSMEYTKLAPGTRPSNNSISETVAMSYDSNFIAHMYNELHDLGPKANMYHSVVGKDGLPQRLPRIEMIVGKNKISSFKNSLYFDFYPASSDFIGIDEAVIVDELQAIKEQKEQSSFKQGKIQQGNLYDN